MNPRPILFGYIRADVLTTDDAVARARSGLQKFAHSEEFTLGTVFVERGPARTGAIHALLDEVVRNEEAWGVVVPDRRHLVDAVRRLISRRRRDCTGMAVLVARPAP